MERKSILVSMLANDRGGRIFLAILAVVAILVPILNLVVSDTSALHVPTYLVT